MQRDINYFDKLTKKNNNEEVEIFDTVLEFLYVEGYAETLEEAEWLMANVIDREAIDNILEVLDTPEKANEYAKKNVKSMLGAFAKGVVNKDITQLKTIQKRGEGAKMAKRKAERKVAALKNEEFEFWVGALVEEGYDLSGYTWDEMYEFYLDEEQLDEVTSADYMSLAKTKKSRSAASIQARAHASRLNKPEKETGKKSSRPSSPLRSKMTQDTRDAGRLAAEYGSYDEPGYGSSSKGSLPKGKKLERQKATGVSEAQEARNNPEKYEAGEKKKSAPVRGERTPMPPRGDKRREDFEKWYAANGPK
jgi:hypothetical protein